MPYDPRDVTSVRGLGGGLTEGGGSCPGVVPAPPATALLPARRLSPGSHSALPSRRMTPVMVLASSIAASAILIIPRKMRVTIMSDVCIRTSPSRRYARVSRIRIGSDAPNAADYSPVKQDSLSTSEESIQASRPKLMILWTRMQTLLLSMPTKGQSLCHMPLFL